MQRLSKKVCLLGDFAVGKTSLVRRFVYDLFDDRYISTIGVKVSRKTLVVPGPEGPVEMAIMLWDLAGNENFDAYRATYMRGAAGAILVHDLSRPETLKNIETYATQMESISPGSQFAVAGNKVDLSDRNGESSGGRITGEGMAGEEIAAHLGAPYYLTSAKEAINIDEIFRHLARRLTSNSF